MMRSITLQKSTKKTVKQSCDLAEKIARRKRANAQTPGATWCGFEENNVEQFKKHQNNMGVVRKTCANAEKCVHAKQQIVQKRKSKNANGLSCNWEKYGRMFGEKREAVKNITKTCKNMEQ